MKKTMILVGGGDFGRELINWAYDVCSAGTGQEFDGFLDDNPNALDNYSYGLPYLGTIDSYSITTNCRFVIGITNPIIKKKVVHQLKGRGAIFANLIHPSCVIARTAKLGEGVVVCPNALVSCDAQIGNFVSINGLSSIGHDAIVGDFSTLSAHVDLTGFVDVGECVFFGTGAKVLPKVRIGSGARIGAGATVIRSVLADSVMYTAPAKRL